MTEIDVDIRDWYFAAVGRADVWSTRRGAWVRSGDADYLAWRTRWGADLIALPSEAELDATLRRAGLPGPDLAAYAAEARWRREIGGIVVGGIPIATDDRSKLLLAGARIQAAADPEWSTVWAAADGRRHPMTAAQVIAISAAVLAHVDAGFRLYDEVLAGISGGSITTPAEIDAAFAAVGAAE